jgi:hypothetical protein
MAMVCTGMNDHMMHHFQKIVIKIVIDQNLNLNLSGHGGSIAIRVLQARADPVRGVCVVGRPVKPPA